MSFLSYPATDQQKKLLDITGELADTFAVRAAEGDWEGRFHPENFVELHQAGYLMLTLPRDFGGWGAPLVDVVLAQQRLAQGDASTALVTSMHLVHTARLAQGQDGSNPVFARICEKIVRDGALINSAATEPATGSPSRGGRPATTARRQPDGSWIINGRKTFTTGSYALHFILVSCSLEDEAQGTALPPLNAERGTFLLERPLSGLHIEDTWNTLGMRGTASNDLVLEDVHVEPEAYVEQYLSTTSNGSAHQAAWSFAAVAVYLGIAQAARDEAVSFARRRRPNSLQQSIASVPHIQEKVAKMDLALMQSKAVLYGVAEQFDADPSRVRSSDFSVAKYLVTNHAVEVVDLAMRVAGGAGLSLSLPLQRYYRDVRAGLQYPPQDDITIAQLARQALEQ